jgi:hypothetical protein
VREVNGSNKTHQCETIAEYYCSEQDELTSKHETFIRFGDLLFDGSSS